MLGRYETEVYFKQKKLHKLSYWARDSLALRQKRAQHCGDKTVHGMGEDC